MDNKKYRISTITGAAVFITGLLLLCARGVDITSHKFVNGKILTVSETSGECRRVSGKSENCIKANVEVEFPINRAGTLHKGQIYLEHLTQKIQPGAEIKVMFKARKPETVKLADFSSGWKGPLGIFFIGALILIVSSKKQTDK